MNAQLREDVVNFLRAVAGMVLPRDDGTHTQDDVREKKEQARALLDRIEE